MPGPAKSDETANRAFRAFSLASQPGPPFQLKHMGVPARRRMFGRNVRVAVEAAIPGRGQGGRQHASSAMEGYDITLFIKADAVIRKMVIARQFPDRVTEAFELRPRTGPGEKLFKTD